MKKLILLLSVLSFWQITEAQIVIEQSDYFRFGNEYYRSFLNSNLDSIDLNQSSGPGQTWDFSWLDNSFTDTLRIIKADLTPYFSSFPDAEFGLTTNLSNYFYEAIEPGGTTILGKVNYDPFNQESTIYQFNSEGYSFVFPTSYQTTFDFSYSSRVQYAAFFPGSDSLRVWNKSNFSLEADAWGQLSIPLGTFDVLRLKQLAYITDTVFVYNDGIGWTGPTIRLDTVETWLFYAKDIGYRLLSFNQRIGGTSKAVNWLKDYNLSATEPKKQSTISVFPQPAKDVLKLAVLSDSKYEIYDLLGKRMDSGRLQNGQNSIPLTDFQNGTYLLMLKSLNGESIATTKFLVIRES